MVDLYDLAFARNISGGGTPAPTPVVKPYIEFTGTQYIRTGFSPASDTSKLEYTLIFSHYVPQELAWADWEYIFGGYNLPNNARPGGLGRPGYMTTAFKAVVCSGETFERNVPTDTNIHTFVLGKRNTGDLYSVLDDDTWGAYMSGAALGNVGLGAGLDANGDPLVNNIKGYAKIRVYEFSIKENDVLVKNFVPRVQNNVAGFLETVSNAFCPSEGSEAFIYGEYEE